MRIIDSEPKDFNFILFFLIQIIIFVLFISFCGTDYTGFYIENTTENKTYYYYYTNEDTKEVMPITKHN